MDPNRHIINVVKSLNTGNATHRSPLRWFLRLWYGNDLCYQWGVPISPFHLFLYASKKENIWGQCLLLSVWGTRVTPQNTTESHTLFSHSYSISFLDCDSFYSKFCLSNSVVYFYVMFQQVYQKIIKPPERRICLFTHLSDKYWGGILRPSFTLNTYLYYTLLF